MKTYLLQKTYLVLIFFLSSTLMEIFLFANLGFGYFPQYAWFHAVWVCFFCACMFGFKTFRASAIFMCVVLGFQVLIGYTNICIHQTLDDVFSFTMLTLVGETAEAVNVNMFPVLPIFFYIGFVCFWAVCVMRLSRMPLQPKTIQITHHVVKNMMVMVVLTLCLGVYSLGTAFLPQNKKSLTYLDDQSLYASFYSSKVALQKFGSYGFYMEQLGRLLYNPFAGQDAVTKEQAQQYLKTQEYQPEELEMFGVCKGSNVISIMAESFEWYAISPELTPTLYACSIGHNFSSNGTFYDVETQPDGSVVLKRNQNTPQADNVGFVLSNFYAKAKTDYSETSFLLGNYPYNQSYTTRISFIDKGLYENISYAFTLPNQLVIHGAVNSTLYVHPYKQTFYGRNTLMSRFGFQETMFIEQMPAVKKDPALRLPYVTLDSEVVKTYASKLLPLVQNDDGSLKTFYTHFTTISTHGSYTGDHPLIPAETKQKVADFIKQQYGLQDVEDENSAAHSFYMYILKALDTEYMLAYLMHYLTSPQQVYTAQGTAVEGRTETLIDNTLLVFFADHQSYYESLDLTIKPQFYTTQGTYTNALLSAWDKRISSVNYAYAPQRYNVPAWVYSTRINANTIPGYTQNITKFTQAFDLTPTICTLLGVSYTPSWYLGYPVMCHVFNETTGTTQDLSTGIYISHTGGIFTQDAFSYDGLTLLYNSKNLTAKQIEQTFSVPVNAYIGKWRHVTALFDYNLFQDTK